MIWEDVLVDRELTWDEVAAGMVELFSVPPVRVWVTRLIEWVPCPDDCAVLCEVEPLGGEFKIEVTIILREESLQPKDTIAFLRQLCVIWECRLLIADESPAWTSRTLITADEEPGHVWLDGDRLDHNEWCLSPDRGLASD